MNRAPAVAGTFYPSTWHSTEDLIDNFFDITCKNVQRYKLNLIPRIFLAPHAGYIYSGLVAAYSYCLLKKIKSKYDTFIILAPAHTKYIKGIALSSNLKWRLFKDDRHDVLIEQDKVLLKSLKNLPFINYDDVAHEKEHAIEVQLPFLYYIYKANFKFAPMLIGEISESNIIKLSEVLTDLLKRNKNIAIIISSDLSHYLPYDLAKKVDAITINQILKAINLTSTVKKNNIVDFKFIHPEQACGAMGINIGILISRNLKYKAKELIYLNSGDTVGDKSAVVGYASIIMGK